MKKQTLLVLIYLLPILIFLNCKRNYDDVVKPAGNTENATAARKTIYYPANVWLVPANNDYTNSNSEYCNQRKAEGSDLAMFWAKEYGNTPTKNPDSTKFDPNEAMIELERFYTCYRDTLKFVIKGSSLTDTYKMLTYVIPNSYGGSAYGGGVDEKIGVLWTPSQRMATLPYGALAHELGHSFQYMVHADGAWGYSTTPTGSNGQTIFEMTSQYMLFQQYVDWMTFENYHLVSFMHQTYLSFLHEGNQYHSPYVLEYWSNKRGRDFVGNLWRNATQGEDAVMTYKRINSMSQSQFNDEMFDANRKFITWDMPRISQAAKPYTNQHICTFNSAGNGWYRIAESNCPQNYGYNGIKLKLPASGTKVTLNFKGIAGASGYRAINVGYAGWRYGFLAVNKNASRTYGSVYSSSNGTATFTVPANTSYLWLVVSGAPTMHWEHLNDGNNQNDEEWPYQIKLTGTTLDNTDIQ